MSDVSSTPAIEIVPREGQCWRCAEHLGLAAACLACEAPQPDAAAADLFEVLGLPRHLAVDVDELERRYHLASRAVHPDRHQTAGERERGFSLTASAAVNRAYRTLRDPIARGRYWLELHGQHLNEDNKAVPPALAATVFETQELLESLRESPSDAGRRRQVEQTLADLTARVAERRRRLVTDYAAWDAADPAAADVLADLKRRLSELAYLGTLRADVERTLEA